MDFQNNMNGNLPKPPTPYQPPAPVPSPLMTIEEVSAPLANVAEGIQQVSQELVQNVQQASQGFINGAQQASQGLANNAQQASQGFGEGMIRASQGLVNSVENASKGLADGIQQASNNISQGMQNASQGIMEAPENISDTFTLPKESLSEKIVPNVGKSMFDFETIFTIFLLIGLLALVVVYGFQYFYNIDLIAKIKNIFSNHPEVEIKVEKRDESEPDPEKKDAIDNDVGQILRRPQVFNIPENNYIYDDAKAICKAYGARLATYEELEEAYNKGAEWCNYGWSEGQMALFPTQQKTWDKLQTIEGHEQDCGRPGINGGYMANKALRYGVNCYGYKPRITKTEKEMMDENEIYPKTKEDEAIEKRTEYWKNKLSEILVSPFNHDKWSKI